MRRTISSIGAVIILLASASAARADDADEILRLRARLGQNLASLQTAAGTVAQCQDVGNCELRLWVAEQFVASTLSSLLSNHVVTLSQTGGGAPPFADGGDALGCGWYVNVSGLNAALALGSVGAQWVNTASIAQLLLQPNFNFTARAQVSGHVNGPPGPCSLFDWSCRCPIGGGIGASVGVSASLNDVLPMIVSFEPTPHQLLVIVRQPQTKRLVVNAAIGLGILGSVRFQIPIDLKATELYRQPMPLAFGTRGSLEIEGQKRDYTVDFTLNGPAPEHDGLALRSRVTINWIP